MEEHFFGGPWTELKLDAVEYYLKFYTVALKNKGFKLWYIDAFAGTGDRAVEREAGGLFDGMPAEKRVDILAGSAKRALAVVPPFDNFVFIELDDERYAALKRLEREDPTRITCLHGDSNEELLRLLSQAPWASQRKPNRSTRGVLFLDPYAMTVPWSTLEAIAASKALDVWYLFPLGAAIRQLAHDFHAVDENKAASLDRIFGTTAWRTEMYGSRSQSSLLDLMDTPERRIDSQGLEAWFGKRLRDLFPLVSEPIPILKPKGAQTFSLFFAMANDDPRAIGAAQNCLRSMAKKFGPQASRRKYVP
jgi:three-Cys-motif partner protein